MKKTKILQRIEQAGVIAVVRSESAEDAVKAGIACVDGGVVGLEVAYTTPNATVAIETLVATYKDNENVVIGAGTVLEDVTALEAIRAGAAFIVSPSFDAKTMSMCHLYQIPYLPGCLSPTEMKQALTFGVDIIKLFPGSGFGPSYVSSVKAPLPHVNIMPTGGVNLSNMAAWFEAGVVAVGIGGDLMSPLSTRDFDGITAKAKKYAKKLEEIKG